MSKNVTIAKASLHEHATVTDILAEAFHDDPVMRYAFRRPEMIRPMYDAVFRHIYAGFDCSFYATDETGAALGCALWAKPGQMYSKVSLRLMLRLAWMFIRRGELRAFKRMAAVDTIQKRYYLSEPHYYLLAIGVRRVHKGRGVGSALLRHILDRADDERVAAYLENSNEKNLPLYQRYGFAVIGVENLPDGGPPLWFMRRPAAGTE
ncbi:MAG: GNAT family N-acetyltransferase [Myxococcota bacterium]